MTENITLTTGQAVGLTGLSMQTIQRYVRAYPMGFSEQARKPEKGRRFNGDDIKNLLLINQMLNAKQKANIEKALSGELESPDLALFEIVNFLQMARNLSAIQKRNAELLAMIERESMSQEYWAEKIRKAVNSQAEEIGQIKRDVKMLQATRKMKNEPEYIPEIEQGKKQVDLSIF
jgi:DNA-binding transcriptional MerR regulator